MNIITILILGGIVYYAMTNKSKNTRNVLLLVAGLLFFCMMNKEGFTLPTEAGTEIVVAGGPTYTFPGGTGIDVTLTPNWVAEQNLGGELSGVTCAKQGGATGQPKWLAGVSSWGGDIGDGTPLDVNNIATIWECGDEDRDCVESTAARSTCTAVDEELWSHTPHSGRGDACTGTSTLCVAGDGSISDGGEAGACSGAPNRTPNHDDCEWDWWGLTPDLDDNKVCDKGKVMDSKCKEEE